MIASAEAPKRIRIGRAKRKPTAIRIVAQTQSIVKRSIHNALCCVRVLLPAEDREERRTASPKEVAEGCDDDNDWKA